MAAFRGLILAALCAGLLSGILVTAAHQIATVPVILEAELFEKPSVLMTAEGHQHTAATAAWEPENGAERAVYTLGADILTGIGFALLLAAGLTLRGGAVTWRDGLFWGLAGFVTFTIAPSLGLPPLLPGIEAAPLFERQVWWVATAVLTGGALALFAFTTRASLAILAAILIVLPHLYGAPQVPELAAAPADVLAHRFIVATTVVNFLFWVLLGASTGYFYGRLQPPVLVSASAAA